MKLRLPFKLLWSCNMAWELQEISFGYDFIGGFQYLDKCGSISRFAQDCLGYVFVQTDKNRIIIKKPESGFVANFGMVNFGLAQNEPEPSDEGKMLLDELKALQPLIRDYINPLFYEKAKFTFEFVYPVQSKENVFEKLSKINSPLFDSWSKEISFPKLMQNLNFFFQSGTTTVECFVYGKSFSIPAPSKKNLNFFDTERQRAIQDKDLLKKETRAGNKYSWAIAYRINVVEDQPIEPTKENGYAIDRINRLLNIGYDVFNKTKREIV